MKKMNSQTKHCKQNNLLRLFSAPTVTYLGVLLCALTAVAAFEVGYSIYTAAAALYQHREVRLPEGYAYTATAPSPLPAELSPVATVPLPLPEMPETAAPATEDEPGETVTAPDAAPDEPPPAIAVYYDVPLSNDLQDYIRGLCEEYGVPMALVLAMIEVESDFQAGQISYNKSSSDWGLMQINTCNQAELRRALGITDFLDPYQNVAGGISMIAGHLEATDGDVTAALMRYNCGPTGARRRWENGIYETSYTRKIMKSYERYENELC